MPPLGRGGSECLAWYVAGWQALLTPSAAACVPGPRPSQLDSVPWSAPEKHGRFLPLQFRSLSRRPLLSGHVTLRLGQSPLAWRGRLRG